MVRTWALWTSCARDALSECDVALCVPEDDGIVAPATVPKVRMHDQTPGPPVGQKETLVLAQIDPRVTRYGRFERLTGQAHTVDPLPGVLPEHQHCGKRGLLARRVGLLAGVRRGKPIRLDVIGLSRGLGDSQVSLETAFVAPAPVAGARGLPATPGVPGHSSDCTSSVVAT